MADFNLLKSVAGEARGEGSAKPNRMSVVQESSFLEVFEDMNVPDTDTVRFHSTLCPLRCIIASVPPSALRRVRSLTRPLPRTHYSARPHCTTPSVLLHATQVLFDRRVLPVLAAVVCDIHCATDIRARLVATPSHTRAHATPATLRED